MTSDERVLQHVAAGDPVPDPQLLDLPPLESVDLTKARTRRAMQTKERSGLTGVPEAERRYPHWAVAVAAAAVTLALVGGLVVGLRALTGGDEVADDGGPIEPALGVAVPIGERARSVVAIDETLFALAGDGTVVRFDAATRTVTGNGERPECRSRAS